MKKAAAAVMNDPVKFAIAAAVVATVGYLLIRQAAKDVGKAAGAAASAAGGIVSGNNAITRGTVYEGTGIAGTAGAAADAATGGLLSSWGESLGGWLYDVTRGSTNKLQTEGDVLREGAANTDALWGKIGNVGLRAQ
jgi:hypothetical protein